MAKARVRWFLPHVRDQRKTYISEGFSAPFLQIFFENDMMQIPFNLSYLIHIGR